MQVNFNPSIGFKNNMTASQPIQQNFSPVLPPNADKKNTGFKEDISKIAKFFTTLGEFSKAIVKAACYGALTGITFLAGGWALKALPNGFKSLESFSQTFKHPIKSIPTKGKLLAATAAVGVAAYHLIKGKLAANQKTANVDHQLKTGHRIA